MNSTENMLRNPLIKWVFTVLGHLLQCSLFPLLAVKKILVEMPAAMFAWFIVTFLRFFSQKLSFFDKSTVFERNLNTIQTAVLFNTAVCISAYILMKSRNVKKNIIRIAKPYEYKERPR